MNKTNIGRILTPVVNLVYPINCNWDFNIILIHSNAGTLPTES